MAKVYPEMVAYDNDGQILTVKYQMLAPMLLNEVQKQNAQLQKQAEPFSSSRSRIGNWRIGLPRWRPCCLARHRRLRDRRAVSKREQEFVPSVVSAALPAGSQASRQAVQSANRNCSAV